MSKTKFCPGCGGDNIESHDHHIVIIKNGEHKPAEPARTYACEDCGVEWTRRLNHPVGVPTI